MRLKKRKPVTYKSLEEKYIQKPTFSGGLQRGAEGVAELLKTRKGRSFLAVIFISPLWLFVAPIYAVMKLNELFPYTPVGLITGAAIFISWFVVLIVVSERERKRRNIERFGKAKLSFKESFQKNWPDFKKSLKRAVEESQMAVAQRDMEELERMKAMDEEMQTRYEAGEITDAEMEAFYKEMKRRLKRMDSKLHKLGF